MAHTLRVIVCLDVGYRAAEVVTGCVVLAAWPDALPVREDALRSSVPAAAYEPGQFYRRELPYLMAAIAHLAVPLDAIVVDAHVWLGPGREGLGAHLHAALGGRCAVVGVAKTSFLGVGPPIAVPVLRGEAQRPLHVSAAGMDVGQAADHVRAMHGPHRIPTALKRADRLARRGTG